MRRKENKVKTEQSMNKDDDRSSNQEELEEQELILSDYESLQIFNHMVVIKPELANTATMKQETGIRKEVDIKQFRGPVITKPMIQITEECIWIGDTGASRHMTSVGQGFSKVYEEKNKASFALKGTGANTEYAGTWIGRQFHQGKIHKQIIRGQQIQLEDVIYVPGLRNNMYSINQAIKEGAQIYNEGDLYILKFKDYELRFDYQMKTKKGHVMCALFYPTGICANLDRDKAKKQHVNIFHQQINHRNRKDLKRTADKLNIELIGELDACIHCARGKIKRARISKELKEVTAEPGEKIGIDSTSCSIRGLGGTKYANVKVDYGSGKTLEAFLKSKDETSTDNLSFVNYVTTIKGKPPKYIRMDNSSENRKFAQICKKINPNIIYQFSAKDTPQQNGKVEAIIAATWNQVRALIDAVELPKQQRKKPWTEAFNTAIMMDGITVKQGECQCADEKWQGELPRWSKRLRIFGEIGVVRKGGKLSKVENRGFDGMFVGCSDNHGLGVYRLLNLKTHRISVTRDVKWMNVSSKEYYGKEDEDDDNVSSMQIIEEDDDNSEGLIIRDAQPRKMLKRMKEVTEDADSETLMRNQKVPIIVETVSSNSSDDSEETPEKKKTTSKLNRELRGLQIDNPSLKVISRALRSRRKGIEGQSILDVDNDEDLLGLLNCISRKDEMVMKCIEQEFGEVYDNEVGNSGREENENLGGFYSAV